jgi:hypothetical protein
MACCKCCCQGGSNPGVCCGTPEYCCRSPNKCCEKQVCCLEEERCCAPSCCSDTECCVDGVCEECECDPPCSTKACEDCTEVTSGVYECVSRCEAAGECCVDGVCQTCPPTTCPDEPCDTGECCVDGYCETCPGCPDDPCPEGECCIDGYCEACTACDSGDCPEGQCCIDGYCNDCPPPECPDSPCPEGECCVDGRCAPCPCDPECSGCSECVDGDCVSTCQPDEFCCDGVCQAEPCDPPCEPECDGCSDCIDGDCVSSCGEGQNCCGGTCQAEPCSQPCCCDGDRVVQTTEGCSPTTPAFPDATPADISVVCDWGGLTVVIDEPVITPSHIYYSGSAVGGASFSCSNGDGEPPLDVNERSMLCNFELFDAGGGCFTMSGNVTLYFSGTVPPNFFSIKATTLGAYPNVCQTTWESEITATIPIWCPNPYGSSITTELIIAP